MTERMTEPRMTERRSSTSALSIGGKILMIALSFSLPIGVLVYLMVDSINSNITVAQAEIAGNAYLRPLEAALQRVQDHYWASWQCEQSHADCQQQLGPIAGEVNAAMSRIAAADARYGQLLKFTPEELTKRGRQHQTAATVAGEWKEMAAAPAPADKYSHLIADLRTMITHAGDTSGLILDPDLDSYYLMDATLIALPEIEDRMASAERQAAVAQAGKPNDTARLDLAVNAAELQSDREHVSASSHTALNEDANFYGVSPTLAAHVQPALDRMEQMAKRNEELVRKVSRGEAVEADELASAARSSRQAAFEYWSIAVDELDHLLDRRIAHYAGARASALAWSGLSLLAASLLAFFFARSIIVPLRGLMRSLGPGATLLGQCVSRISEVSQSKTVDPLEAQIICGELDAHAASMRKAVLELAQHVSGAAENAVSEVTG